MNAPEPPMYRSRRRPASLWQEYRVFPDRLELQAWALFHTIIVPAREIVQVETRPAACTSLKGVTWWGIKLDWADLYPHVRLRRRQGSFKTLAFTPENPDEFVRLARDIAGLPKN